MAALEKTAPSDDWTVVLPRRGKKTKSFHKILPLEQQIEVQPWTPTDTEVDPERESKLLQKMRNCMQKLQNSEFWRSFSDQMQNPDILNMFMNTCGVERKMPMVIYGIGSIESFEPPRLQLGLAILMKRKFDWIGDIEVFDPIISFTEARVLTSLGCSVLPINEQGRRKAVKPTMFFMPHCEAELYDNLLEANWVADQLNHVVIFGNSFEEYDQHVLLWKSSSLACSRKHVLAARRFANEFKVDASFDDSFRAFHGSSWHFFAVDDDTDLRVDKLC